MCRFCCVLNLYSGNCYLSSNLYFDFCNDIKQHDLSSEYGFPKQTHLGLIWKSLRIAKFRSSIEKNRHLGLAILAEFGRRQLISFCRFCLWLVGKRRFVWQAICLFCLALALFFQLFARCVFLAYLP